MTRTQRSTRTAARKPGGKAPLPVATVDLGHSCSDAKIVTVRDEHGRLIARCLACEASAPLPESPRPESPGPLMSERRLSALEAPRQGPLTVPPGSPYRCRLHYERVTRSGAGCAACDSEGALSPSERRRRRVDGPDSPPGLMIPWLQ